jgi:hypothetical protein
LKNKSINEKFSKLSSFFIILQQVFLILLIPQLTIKYGMLLVYITFLILYFTYKRNYSPIYFHTSIGKNGHLSWEWMNYNGYENIWLIISLLFYIVHALLINNVLISLFLLISLFTSLYFYFNYNTFGTMWCWIFNIFLLYFIIDILLIQPYYEYKSLC